MSLKKSKTPKIHPLLPWIALAAGCYSFFAYAYSFWCSWLVGDEGFYTLAARSVMEGMRPYRDFLISQMPLLPYAYAGWFTVAGVSIESARLLCFFLAVGSIILLGFATYRRAGLIPAVFAGFLLGTNIHFVADTLPVKTQALTVFLISCVLFVLADKNPKNRLVQAALGMVFMTLALLARLSILPCLLLLWVYLGWKNRDKIRQIGALILLNLVILAGCFLFFYADGNLIFGIYTFHQEYAQFMPWTWSRLASTIHEWLGNELVIILFFVIAIRLFVTQLLEKRFSKNKQEDILFPAFLLLSFWGATTLHWINAQNYATHQTSLVGFAIAFSAIVLKPALEALFQNHRQIATFAFGSLLLLSELLGHGMNLGLSFNGNRGIVGLQKATATIKQRAKPGATILSFDPELAVESGLRVPPGYEMGEFTYFPKMSDERCAKLKTTNIRKLDSDITAAQSQFLCVDDRLFNQMACGNSELAKTLKEKIDQRYRLIETIPHYGQFDLSLYIFESKSVRPD